MLINSAGVGKSPWKTTRVVRRTKLRIGDAMRAAGDAVAAAGPCPSHGVANRDVDCIRVKRETPARPHRHIKNWPVGDGTPLMAGRPF